MPVNSPQAKAVIGTDYSTLTDLLVRPLFNNDIKNVGVLTPSPPKRRLYHNKE